jgi:adenylate kinase
MAPLNLVLLGPPGAGKGTQAERLEDDFHLPYLATGNLLRAAVTEGTELGQAAKAFMDAGDLVPDELIIEMIIQRVGDEGVLLDGFPRTVGQADALDEKLKLTAALLIDVPDEEVLRRLSGRRVCAQEGHSYHVEFSPPKQDGVCDIDGSPLLQRDDDRAETVGKRLRVYHDQTEPIVEHYEQRGLLRRFEGSRSPTEVHDHLRATIATLRLEDDIL